MSVSKFERDKLTVLCHLVAWFLGFVIFSVVVLFHDGEATDLKWVGLVIISFLFPNIGITMLLQKECKRPLFRFQLSTAVAAVLVCGLMIWLNVEFPDGSAEQLDRWGRTQYGWPYAALAVEANGSVGVTSYAGLGVNLALIVAAAYRVMLAAMAGEGREDDAA